MKSITYERLCVVLALTYRWATKFNHEERTGVSAEIMHVLERASFLVRNYDELVAADKELKRG